jgi:hypothetical protein
MAASEAEFELGFTEVLTSRRASPLAEPLGGSLLRPNRRPEQDGRSPPGRDRRGRSQDSERLSASPGGPRQQIELRHAAQPSRRAKSPSRRTENGPGQPCADAIRKGEGCASAIVRGSYRSVCRRCRPGRFGVGPECLGRFPAETTTRLAPRSPARQTATGAVAWPTSTLIPTGLGPASHIALEGWSASMPEGPTNGWTSHYGGTLRCQASPCGSCDAAPVRALTTVVSPATR